MEEERASMRAWHPVPVAQVTVRAWLVVVIRKIKTYTLIDLWEYIEILRVAVVHIKMK